MGNMKKKLAQNKSAVGLITLSILIIGLFFGNAYLNSKSGGSSNQQTGTPSQQSKFAYLSTHGNSSCSNDFLTSISTMNDNERLQGSCCSPMALSKYVEQVDNLKKYSSISVIPADPYDIPAKLAKQLFVYDKTITPTASEQKVLDAAVAASPEKGYCCCKCWRWYTYEGLSKYLVHAKHFSAKQITDVLANSDGCGGAS